MAPFARATLISLVAIFAVEAAGNQTRSSSMTSSKGCGKALAPGIKQGGTGDSNHFSLDVSDGTTRTYYLHVPPTYDINSPVGLIYSFAGHSETALDQERVSQFSNPEFNPDMLAVYPEGTRNAEGQTQWEGDPSANVNDVAFTLELLDYLLDNYCINETQVYASGKSNGGGFAAHILACDSVANQRFAAYAAASGAFYVLDTAYKSTATCDGSTVPILCSGASKPAQIPIIETHGGADPVISYTGGYRRDACLPSIPHYMQFWAELDERAETNVSTKLYAGNVMHYVFGAGEDSGEVQSYYVPTMGHCWPSTVDTDCSESTYFNATPVFMDFFRRWPRSSQTTDAAPTHTTTGPSRPDDGSTASRSAALSVGRLDGGSTALVATSMLLAMTV